MPRPQGKILIAGGGIAGLTLATALHQRGIEAETAERDAAWAPVGAGLAVQPNGMRVLHELGLGDAVERAGAVIRRWLFRAGDGDVLCTIDLKTVWGGVGPFVGIARQALHEILRGGAVAVPRRLGAAVTSLEQEGDGVVVAFGDGDRGAYSLVLGADGIASSVRRLALGAAPPVYGGQMVWRCLVPFCLQEDAIQFWLGDGLFFGLCPAGRGLTYGFGNVSMPRLHDPAEGRLERLRARFMEFGKEVRDFLECMESDAQIHCAPIEWLELMDRWHVGHVALVGDAAHACSPMMGQGGCMAMEDALVLAEVLHDSPVNAEGALDRYVSRRRPRVELVRVGSDAAGGILGLPPDRRKEILREHGEAAFRDRFRPLIEPP